MRAKIAASADGVQEGRYRFKQKVVTKMARKVHAPWSGDWRCPPDEIINVQGIVFGC
jgi:hypothetical protein